MLDPDKIQQIAESYSPQEMFAALIWQRQFNNFDGQQVVTDLYSNTNLCYSFSFSKAVYASDRELSFTHVVTTLLAMANYRPMPLNSRRRYIAYPADTLYILTENEHTLISELIDLGKRWKADSVEVIDRHNQEYGCFTQSKLRESLAEKDKFLDEQSNLERLEAVVVAYWWD